MERNMNKVIQIGADEESVSRLGKTISEVFDSARKNSMDQSTIVKALQLMESASKAPAAVTISHCCFDVGAEDKADRFAK